MMYRAKVTAYYDVLRPMLVDFNPSYCRDAHDVFVEVSDEDLAESIEFINSLPAGSVSKILYFCNSLRIRDLLSIQS